MIKDNFIKTLMDGKRRMSKCFLIFCLTFYLGCSSSHQTYSRINCAYLMDADEVNKVRERGKMQGSVYEADTSGNIYDQFNDTIRSSVPDTPEFEIFMFLLNEKEVGIQVWAQRDSAFIQQVTCKFMEAKFKGKIPEQRYILFWNYSHPDGSGDLQFEAGYKFKED